MNRRALFARALALVAVPAALPKVGDLVVYPAAVGLPEPPLAQVGYTGGLAGAAYGIPGHTHSSWPPMHTHPLPREYATHTHCLCGMAHPTV